MMLPNFHLVRSQLEGDFRMTSSLVHTEKWQGTEIKDNPAAAMHELTFVHFQVPLAPFGRDLDLYRKDIQPNLPWADDHFEERVCGAPINPGTQWAKWPFGHSADKFRSNQGQFNHNYMERYWPKYAGRYAPSETAEEFNEQFSKDPLGIKALPNFGIRYHVGDLKDVVKLLHREPLTRQAYLPVWFPEDTGAVHGGRVPCTLGYHWMMRNHHLHTSYFIRSCDYVRHFNDDIYMTIRLTLWILDQLRERDLKTWGLVKPGWFRMDIGSLHMFRNDYLMKFGK